MSKNKLSDFTYYIEELCIMHIDILHSEDNRHFVELNNEQQLTDSKVLCYPLVTLDKLTVTYGHGEDFMTKTRNVELMFLSSVGHSADFKKIQEEKNKMEAIAEDFIRKIKKDKRDRSYDFLRNLLLSDLELNFVENPSMGLYGVLLTFDFELSFDETLAPGRFI